MAAHEAAERRPLYGQFSTALRFSVRDQTRNQLVSPLLVLVVPL